MHEDGDREWEIRNGKYNKFLRFGEVVYIEDNVENNQKHNNRVVSVTVKGNSSSSIFQISKLKSLEPNVKQDLEFGSDDGEFDGLTITKKTHGKNKIPRRVLSGK